MAKLFRILETQFNSELIPGGRYVAYSGKQVISVVDKSPAGAYCIMKVNKLDGTNPDYVEAASAASAVLAAMNATFTTDVNVIAVTVIPDSGSNYTKNVPVDLIHRVATDPLNSARSYMGVEDVVKTQIKYYHITSTPAQVVTAANA